MILFFSLAMHNYIVIVGYWLYDSITGKFNLLQLYEFVSEYIHEFLVMLSS